MDEIGDLALIVHSSDSYLPVQDQIPSVIVQWPTYERERRLLWQSKVNVTMQMFFRAETRKVDGFGRNEMRRVCLVC